MMVVPMLQVDDVAAASAWYQEVLGFVSGHGGDEFEMLFAGEPHRSPLVLQLRRWEADEHGLFGSPNRPVGNGCSLWFQCADRAEFDAAWARATAAGATVRAMPAWNGDAHRHEFSLRDRNGYVLAVHTPLDFDGVSAGSGRSQGLVTVTCGE